MSIQSLVEWRASRKRRHLQQLALRVRSVPSGYFRIGSYLNTTEDKTRFARADRAHEKVLAWIEQSAGLPLYLTGGSGSGKSSLLNASVLPALRELGWTVVEARACQDPVQALRDAVSALTGLPHRRVLETLKAIAAIARRTAGTLLLVLDQFEEFLILGKAEQQKAFAGLLAELRSAPVSG